MKRSAPNDETANKKMVTFITDFVRSYPEKYHTETVWREPVIGFANADDPLFFELKHIIGPDHALPFELLEGAKSVIVYFIPFSKETIQSNISKTESSREWDYANIETNFLLSDLNKLLYDVLNAQGYRASLLPPTYNYDEDELVSDWSHKSAAYIAGIGRFGINHVLITDKGCCGRIGSVITNLEFIPTPRSEKEYCLYKYNKSCGKCIKKCVAQAFCISQGTVLYDRHRCNEQIYNQAVPRYPIGNGDACGKCMCGVPCSFRNPCSSLQ